jgi:hypothetical protein
MDLRKFVSQTIAEVVHGVIDAQAELKETGARVNPLLHPRMNSDLKTRGPIDNSENVVQEIVFDVALTVSSETGTDAKVSVLAGIFGLGAGGRSADQQGHTTKVSFTVPVSFPKG